MAREERYVLDGEREQLSAIKRELDGLRSQAVYGAAAADASAAVARAAHAAHDGAFAQASSAAAGVAPAWASPGPGAPASPVAGEGERLYGFGGGNAEISPLVAPQPRGPPPAPDSMPPRSPPSAASDSELFRLQRERDELLQTGQYGSSHPIIAELDRMISDAAGEGAFLQHQEQVVV